MNAEITSHEPHQTKNVEGTGKQEAIELQTIPRSDVKINGEDGAPNESATAPEPIYLTGWKLHALILG
jgi:hypothetical protein